MNPPATAPQKAVSLSGTGWTPRTRFASQLVLVLAGLVGLDIGDPIFGPHRFAYWAGLGAFLVLCAVWNDLLPASARDGSILSTPNAIRFSPETRRTRIMRVVYQALWLIGFLVIVDRVVERVFTGGHSLFFWLSLAAMLAFVAGWYDLARSATGQRILASAGAERITLIGFSLLTTLALLEVFVRSEFSRHHVFGVWPTWEITSDPPIAFTLNSAGYRDEEHSLTASPGVTRIVVVGDSVTAGYAVPQTSYYPVRLRELAGPTYEFIIAAQPAAETVHEIAFLRDYGCQYHPDVVVVGVFSNDPYLGLERNTPPWPPQWDVFKRLESPYSFNPDLIYMFDGVINSTANSLGRYSYADWLATLYDPDEPWINLWHPVVRELAELARSCGARQLYAFTLPEPADYSRPEIRARFERIHDILAEGFTQAGFVTTNLFPAYVDAFGGTYYRSLWAIPNDPHPNAEIHAWYARQIWAVLQNSIDAAN